MWGRKRKELEPPPESLEPVAPVAKQPDAEDLEVSVEIVPESSASSAVAPGGRPVTVLAEDTKITGDVQTGSALRLSGEIEGTVNSASTVAVAADGSIKGAVSATEVELAGRVHGEVKARKLSVQRTGRIEGDVTVERLVVEDGGLIEGRCHMKSS